MVRSMLFVCGCCLLILRYVLAGKWAAHYFFSSGNEQDVHTLHLTSFEDEEGRGTRLEGRGTDFLGAFRYGLLRDLMNEKGDALVGCGGFDIHRAR